MPTNERSLKDSSQLTNFDYKVSFNDGTDLNKVTVLRSDGKAMGTYDLSATPPPVIDGFTLAVKSGAVQAANTAGNQLVSSGQVAFVPPILPPIILPRGTPARSGVMHSISSMPRARSQVAASFQFETPRFDPGSGGITAFLEGAFWDLIMDFFAGMSHRLVVNGAIIARLWPLARGTR